MTPPRGLKVNRFVRTAQFDRTEKDLPPYARQELKKLIREMMEGEYSNGRNLKKRKGTRKNQPKEWQARLDQDHRITFNYKKGVATFLKVGPHKLFD